MTISVGGESSRNFFTHTKDRLRRNQTICDDFQGLLANEIAKVAEKIRSITNSGSQPPPVEHAHFALSSVCRFDNISDDEVL